VIAEGAFIRANFPLGDAPEARSQPGSSPHIAYYLGSRSEAGIIVEIMLAYTNSGRWRGASPRTPLGVLEFSQVEAAKLNQRPFHIDLRCLARVLPIPIWFPDWNEPGRGLVAVASAEVKERILREAERLVKSSPEIIEVRGIGGHTTTTTKRPSRPRH
jgi:hypothetical protein